MAKEPRYAICVGVGALGASDQLTMYSRNQVKCGGPAQSEHTIYIYIYIYIYKYTCLQVFNGHTTHCIKMPLRQTANV